MSQPFPFRAIARAIESRRMGRRLWGFGLVASLIALAGIAACRQLIGITDNPPTDLTSTLCGLAYGTSACASCVSANCCTESTACSVSAACTTYQTCIGKCNGDPGCRTQCMISDPGVAPEVSMLNACLASHCETPCGLTCGSIVERLTPPDAGAPCETCFQTNNACAAATACASSVDCDEYTRCFVACPTPDCQEACETGHDAGVALFAPVQQVYANACSKACAYGQNWNCVGHVVWPATNITAVTQTVTALDYNTGLPVPGVEICLSEDCATCGSQGSVYAAATTDMSGFWKVTLPLPAIGAFGATQPSFQGCARFSSPTIVTQWGNDGFPQTNATWNIAPSNAGTPFTPSELAEDFMAVGASWDSSRAVISMRVYDCLGTPAPDVQVASDTQDSQTVVYYSGANSATSVSTITANATGSTGIAAFINVPAPDAGAVNVRLTATPVGLGKASSEETVGVQAGVVTVVGMTPTPSP